MGGPHQPLGHEVLNEPIDPTCCPPKAQISPVVHPSLATTTSKLTSPIVAPLLAVDRTPPGVHSRDFGKIVENHMQTTTIPVARIFSSLFSQLDNTALSVAFGECVS